MASIERCGGREGQRNQFPTHRANLNIYLFPFPSCPLFSEQKWSLDFDLRTSELVKRYCFVLLAFFEQEQEQVAKAVTSRSQQTHREAVLVANAN